MRPPAHVIVVSGGLSFKREISLKSGHLVADALQDAGLDVLTVDVDGGLLETLTSLGSDTVAFMALHGPAGEDGSLQDVLDASGIRYVGSSGDASRLAYDKPTAKYLAHCNSLATPSYAAVTEQTFRDLGTELVLDRLGHQLGIRSWLSPRVGGRRSVSWSPATGRAFHMPWSSALSTAALPCWNRTCRGLRSQLAFVDGSGRV